MRKCLFWTTAIILLTLLGLGIHYAQPPAPMRSIAMASETACLSRDGRMFATWNMEARLLQVWDTRSGGEIGNHSMANNGVIRLSFSPDGRYLAALGYHLDRIGGFKFQEGDMSLWIYEVATKRLLATRPSFGSVCKMTQYHHDFLKPTVFVRKMAVHEAIQGGRHGIEIYNPGTNARAAFLAEFGVFLTPAFVSPDENYLVVVCANSDDRQCEIWNLATLSLLRKIETGAALFSKDGRWLTTTAGTRWINRIDLLEMPNALKVAEIAVDDALPLAFSPDGTRLLLQDMRNFAVRVVEVPTMTKLWERSCVLRCAFSSDSARVFMTFEKPEVLALDSTNGAVCARIPLSGKEVELANTPDDRALLIHQQSEPLPDDHWLCRIPLVKEIIAKLDRDTIVVVDTDSCGERFRLYGSGAKWAKLSDDGDTLLTGHVSFDGGDSLRTWDVNARKPLHWAIGIPTTLAALLACAALWRSRRASRRAAQSAVGQVMSAQVAG